MLRFKNILFYLAQEPVEADAIAFVETVELAKKNGAKLTLLGVFPPVSRWVDYLSDGPSAEELDKLVVADKQQRLDDFISAHADGFAAETKLLAGKPELEIVKEVLRHDFDLVIKAARPDWEGSPHLGSLDKSLIRTCPCPVWLIKGDRSPAIRKVMAAIDLEDHDDTHALLNRTIMALAKSLAQRKNIPLHIVSAWDFWMDQPLRRRAGDYEVDAWVEAKQEKVVKDLDKFLNVTEVDHDAAVVHLGRGIPAKVIEETCEQEEIDLLVMGTVCRTGLSGFIVGNTAETIISRTPCSVIAVKPDGYQSPITI